MGMRRLLALAVVAVMVGVTAPAVASTPVYDDFVAFDSGIEGVAVDRWGTVYVSADRYELVDVGAPDLVPMFAAAQVWKIEPGGEPELIHEFPADPPGSPISAVGLSVDRRGNVYAAVGFNGVFKIDTHGSVELIPGTEQIVLPNSLAFDWFGNLFITETFSFDPDTLKPYPGPSDPTWLPPASPEDHPGCSLDGVSSMFGDGAVWVAPRGGEAQLLVRDPLLTGTCLGNPIPFPAGANGIVVHGRSLFVANTEQGTIVRIPLRWDRTAKAPQVFATLPAIPDPTLPDFIAMPNPDGLALDWKGNFYTPQRPDHVQRCGMALGGSSSVSTGRREASGSRMT
jgi:sugar lactone lactonase YvrE